MLNVVNPEAIGVFGLIITVWVFGLEQLGFGVKGGDHTKIARTLALVAFWFGGVCQVFTALSMYLFDVVHNPGMSIFLGTVFADYGLFWIVVSYFFKDGGDKKQLAHFFVVQLLISLVFTYITAKLGILFQPLGIVLMLIDALFLTLPFAYYTGSPALGKLAGAINIAVGVAAVPIFIKAIMGTLFGAGH